MSERARSAGRLALIGEALHALDRADQGCRHREGMSFTIEKTKTVHLQPLVKVERERRGLFAKVWSGMCHLDWDCHVDGRIYRPEGREGDDEEKRPALSLCRHASLAWAAF